MTNSLDLRDLDDIKADVQQLLRAESLTEGSPLRVHDGLDLWSFADGLPLAALARDHRTTPAKMAKRLQATDRVLRAFLRSLPEDLQP